MNIDAKIYEMQIAATEAAAKAVEKGQPFRGAFEFAKELGYYDNEADRRFFCAIFANHLPAEILCDENGINI